MRESFDRRTFSAPGQLVDVGGHRLHLHCVGSGTPTVILESGLGERCGVLGMDLDRCRTRNQSLRLRSRGSRLERFCLSSRTGMAVATDLHTLLDRAHVPGPFVLVGHSSGAQYVRIFAGRYPEQVAGMVLLDGQPAEAFERPSKLPSLLQRLPPHLCAVPVVSPTRRGTVGLPCRLCQFARASARHAASPLLVGSAVPQPARRICRVAHVARAGSFVSEPRRPAAGRRDRRAGCTGGMAAAARQDGDLVHEQQPPRRALHA